MSLASIKRNDVVSFQIYPVGLIKGTFDSVTFQDRVSANTARLLNTDVVAVWNSVYPTLPEGTTNDPYLYDWLTFTTSTGEFIVLASVFINEATLTTSESSHYQIDIYDGDVDVLTEVRKAINAVGYYNIAIKRVD